MRDEILVMLIKSENAYISGEAISRELGVTRAAIWKAIKNLKNEGYIIESVSNKGYCLKSMPDVLEKVVLDNLLSTRVIGRVASFYKSVESTNMMARELALKGVNHGTLVVAEEQTAGRGRLGRAWVSPAGTGIWMSLILRPSLAPQYASRITFIAALAVAEAIHRLTGLKVGIKWPNDIILGTKKVCGILTEIQAEPDIINHVILGIGININGELSTFSDELQSTATTIKMEYGETVDRMVFMACVLDTFERLYDHTMATNDFESILMQYKRYSVTLNSQVRVSGRIDTFEGIAIDFTEDGALVVKLSGGSLQKVLSGDVSVRGIAGYL